MLLDLSSYIFKFLVLGLSANEGHTKYFDLNLVATHKLFGLALSGIYYYGRFCLVR
jgi:hypothetical protein